MFCYLHQKCAVKWGNTMSETFSVSNGVRQGAVASPTFFNVYIDALFKTLRDSGLGCTIDHCYYGFLGYADDCALLSPSRDTLQIMLNTCSKYFKEHGIKISTDVILEKSKTKCLAINVPADPVNIVLYDIPLPWVDSYKHLGHYIHSDQNMSHDTLRKRGEFIGNVHAMRQEMGDQNPVVFLALINIYFSSFYGSNLWDLFSEEANKVYTSWNVLIRSSFKLPFATHRYILYELYKKAHIRVCLLKRFVKFYNSLKVCTKPEVRHLFQYQKSDCRSIFGRNCHNLCREMGVFHIEDVNIDSITMSQVVAENDGWRIPFLFELLDIRDGAYDSDLTQSEINDIMTYVCCS